MIAGGVLDIGESAFFMRWSRRRRAVTGVEALVGGSAVVVDPQHARVAGELWRARSDDHLIPGEEVEILAVDGMTLVVTRRQSPAPR